MCAQEDYITSLRADQTKQLDEISAQLLIFEASLRAKERRLQETLASKESIINKQQKVIKQLIKKGLNNMKPAVTNPPPAAAAAATVTLADKDDSCQPDDSPKTASLYARRTGEDMLLLDTVGDKDEGQKSRQQRYQRVSSIKSDPDYRLVIHMLHHTTVLSGTE